MQKMGIYKKFRIFLFLLLLISAFFFLAGCSVNETYQR